MNEIDVEFQKFFGEQASHYLGQAFAAWIESIRQVAYNIALSDWNTLQNKEGDENDSTGETNDTQQ